MYGGKQDDLVKAWLKTVKETLKFKQKLQNVLILFK